MKTENDKKILKFDARRNLIVPGDKEATIDYCVHHFAELANAAIASHGRFSVALSGGSTPKAIYQALAAQEIRQLIDWKKCWLFWSDERAIAPTEIDSNYHMAMEAGLRTLGIPSEQIFRMVAESDIAEHALAYENAIKKHVPNAIFDLVMLGMGDDGHTASLFPWTEGLSSTGRLVIANYIPEKKVWRMTLTFECINAAYHTAIYVMGENKADMVQKVLKGNYEPDELPIQRVGTDLHPSLWICDDAAARKVR